MSRRRLSEDERTLWSGVTRSIAPLHRRLREAAKASPETAPERPVRVAKSPKSSVAPQPRRAPVTPPPLAPPTLAPLGRKAKRRVARDDDALHGRLDLHGMTQAEAHAALVAFLHSARARDGRLVLVITGKGARSGEPGVLKRQVPMWLRLPELRGLVAGFETAHIGHGGEGALYVRLRRNRDS